MKRLTLLRHAKSGMDDPAVRDVDRPLNGKGHRAAHKVGEMLRAEGFAFDRVVASPARRVRETLEQVSAGYGAPLDPLWERRIYLASAVTLLDVVHETPDSCESLLLVGHNPGLEDLVLMLVPGGGEARGNVEEKYPTASVAEILFDGDDWSALTCGHARLARFIRPRDVDPTLGPTYD